MKPVTRYFVLAALLVFLLTGLAAAEGVTLSVDNELDLDQPSLALLKYASFFVTDLGDFGEEPIMTITLHNNYQEAVPGYFSARLYTSSGKKIGEGDIKEIPVFPGTTSWQINAGGLTNVELLTDVLEKVNEDEDIPSEDYLKDKFDLGDIEDWDVNNTWADKAWFKENVFDYSEYTDFDDNDIPEIIDTALSLQVPKGTYRLEITFNYTTPAENSRSVSRTVRWQVTNPEPVELIGPLDNTKDLSFEPEFIWRLPDLPDGFETTSSLIITDTVTGNKKTVEIEHTSGYDSEFDTTISRSQYDFLRGRWYKWNVVLTGPNGKVIGDQKPDPQRFALSNTMPEVELSSKDGLDDLMEGDSVTFEASFEDEGTPDNDLEVIWRLDGSEITPDSDDQYTYSSMEPGSHTLEVEVFDGFDNRDSAAASLGFFVQENLPPVVSIDLTTGRTEYVVGETVSFESEVSDPENEGLRRIEWYVDGTRVSSGESFELRPGKGGQREVKLVAEDIRGKTGEDYMTITVAENMPPEVTITSPEEGEYLFGQSLELEAKASDDLMEDLDITWEVMGGQKITGDTYTIPEAEGEIVLRAWTQDEQGQTGDAAVTINAVPNTPPEVIIISPEAGTTFTMEGNNNKAITIEAVAEADDPDQGQEINWSWEIIDSKNNQVVDSGQTGQSASFEFDIEKSGIYTLVAQAIDSYGDSGTSSVAFSVVKPVPAEQKKSREQLEPVIEAPAESSTFYVGEEVTLRGGVRQNRFASNTVYNWMIDDNRGVLGTIGTGQELTYVFAHPGEKTLRLIAMNKNAINGEAEILITVLPNTPPEITIDGIPEDGIIKGTEAVLTAVVSDDEGHEVTTTWKVNGVDVPADAVSGNRLDLSFLPVGNNTITLIARDELGAYSREEALIPIRANQPPVINITDIPEEAVIGSQINVSYQVTDPDEDNVTVSYEVLGPDGSTVQAQSDNDMLIFTVASTGDYVVTIRGEDSRGSTAGVTEIIKAVENKPPVVKIMSPVPGSMVNQGQEFEVELNVFDPEGDEISSYEINGTTITDPAYSESRIVLPFTVNQSGPVVLNVTVADQNGKSGNASVGVIARSRADAGVSSNQPPVVNIVVPQSASEGITFGETLNMTAITEDPDNKPEEVIINWFINDQLAGTGPALKYNFTVSGQVKVEVEAVDITGAAGSAETTVMVEENQSPAGGIIEPPAEAKYDFQQTVNLMAEAVDPEGHEISYMWLLDDESIGADNPLTYTFTTPGSHSITLRATDFYGAGSEFTRTITVAAPEGETLPPEIVQPLDRLVLTDRTAMMLQANNIPEGAQVVWRSSLDGVLYSAEAVSLSPGEHLIMLLVNGVQVDSVTVFVVAEEVEKTPVAGLMNLTGTVILRRDNEEILLNSENYLEYEVYNGNILEVNENSSIELFFYHAEAAETSEILNTGTYQITELRATAEENIPVVD